jgi:hypothetical protein
MPTLKIRIMFAMAILTLCFVSLSQGFGARFQF